MQCIIAAPELWEALLTKWSTPISQHIASRDFITSISRYSEGGKCFVYFRDEHGNEKECEEFEDILPSDYVDNKQLIQTWGDYETDISSQ